MARIQVIDGLLSHAAQGKEIPGVVAIAATDTEIIYEGAFGKRNLDQDAVMTPDTVVWIASMTKAITATAAMQLVERGKLKLDAPAAEVVPELEKVQVLSGFDASGKPILRKPKTAVTLMHLLTHTAGFTYEFWNADTLRFQSATGTPSVISCQNAALNSPLAFNPGERWEYGINLDWVGKMIEAASTQTLEDYLQENILTKLGMNSTSFKISASQRERLASIHARTPDGSLAVYPFEVPQEPEFQMGGGGLYGTALDYIRFAQMILNRGMSGRERVLQPETVQLMCENHIGELDCGEWQTAIPALSNSGNFFPGMKQQWGLAWLINMEPTHQGRSKGSLAWAGLANTFFWIDPAKRVTGVFLTQILPFFDPKAVNVFRDFETLVYKIL